VWKFHCVCNRRNACGAAVVGRLGHPPPPPMIFRALSRVVDSDVALKRWPVCAPLTGGVLHPATTLGGLTLAYPFVLGSNNSLSGVAASTRRRSTLRTKETQTP
jgi:hypothetical protein